MLIAGGLTDVSLYFVLRLTADGTAATGLTITDFDLQYLRSGEEPSTKADATALAATDSAHADNKGIEIDATDQPGLYRFDFPDAAFAAGVRETICSVKVATAFAENLRVEIDTAAQVWDRVISMPNHNIGQSAGKILRQSGDLMQIDGAVSDASPTTTNFDTNLTQMDGYFDDTIMVFSNGAANAGIGKPVSAYVNANGNVTFIGDGAWPETPVNGDDFVIVALHSHPLSEIADEVWAKTMTELASVPGVEDTVLAALQWVFLLARNKGTQTPTTKTLRNDADDGDIATSAISSIVGLFTRGKWS